MATPPIPTPSQSKLLTILAIIQAALTGLALVPGPVGAIDKVGLVFYGILMNALAAYQAESGTVLDVTKIPFETPVA
jgi:hypothetical protein